MQTQYRAGSKQTFGVDFKVCLAVDLYTCLFNARPSGRHLAGVSRLAHCHQVRTLGNVLFGKLDGHLVLAFHSRHIDARVRYQAVFVVDHVTLQYPRTNMTLGVF